MYNIAIVGTSHLQPEEREHARIIINEILKYGKSIGKSGEVIVI